MARYPRLTRTTLVTGATLAAGCLASGTATADASNLDKRVSQLEDAIASDANDQLPSVDFSGLVEVEPTAGEDFEGSNTSDIVLATVELGAQARLNQTVTANALLLFEEDTQDDIEVDAANIVIDPSSNPYRLTVGRFYVPFGVYETAFIDDPLPLELGETRETAVMGGFETAGWRGQLWAFNGDSDDGSDNTIGQYGVTGGYALSGDTLSFDSQISLINSIADSDTLTDTINAATPVNNLDDQVAGATAQARLEAGSVAMTGEYISGLSAFDASELPFDGGGAQPAAWQAELAHSWDWATTPVTIAAGYQGTAESLALGLPRHRALLGATIEPWSATSLSLQLAKDWDYDEADGGTGNTARRITAQLAVSF